MRESLRPTVETMVLYSSWLCHSGLNINISRILGRDAREYSVVQSDEYGNVTLLSGITKNGKSYSEFHFGAGESSIIKMVMKIESISEQGRIYQ